MLLPLSPRRSEQTLRSRAEVRLGRHPGQAGRPPVPYYLYAGTLFAPAEPHIVTTVLGSCVALCLWDRKRRIGGINHFMSPEWNGSEPACPKFGSVALPELIQKLERLGCARKNLVAKVFGGKASESENAFDVGPQNVRYAKEWLAAADMPVLAEDCGGTFGRKLHFHTGTGEVLLKRFLCG